MAEQKPMADCLRVLLREQAPRPTPAQTISRDVRRLMYLLSAMRRFDDPFYKTRKIMDEKVAKKVLRYAEAIIATVRGTEDSNGAPASVRQAFPSDNGIMDHAESIRDDALAALQNIKDRTHKGPRKQIAHEIEKATFKIFERYQGPGTAHRNYDATKSRSYGPYPKFVQAVFDVMHIDARALGAIQTRLNRSRPARQRTNRA